MSISHGNVGGRVFAALIAMIWSFVEKLTVCPWCSALTESNRLPSGSNLTFGALF